MATCQKARDTLWPLLPLAGIKEPGDSETCIAAPSLVPFMCYDRAVELWAATP